MMYSLIILSNAKKLDRFFYRLSGCNMTAAVAFANKVGKNMANIFYFISDKRKSMLYNDYDNRL